MSYTAALAETSSQLLNAHGVFAPDEQIVRPNHTMRLTWDIESDEITVGVWDESTGHMLAVSFDPEDFENNCGNMYKYSTGEHKPVYNDRLDAMCGYMLKLIQEAD